MQTFKVRLRPNGKLVNDEYQNVDAETALGAAEKLHGKPLKATGPFHEIRAEIFQLVGNRGTSTIFYEA